MRNGPRPSVRTAGGPSRSARLPGGEAVDLVALAAEICARYRAEFPDEQERYGDAGLAWCVHDNQHILNWAVLARSGDVDLDRELAWLARVLGAPDCPHERLARNLEIASDVVRERLDGALADDLSAAARAIPA